MRLRTVRETATAILLVAATSGALHAQDSTRAPVQRRTAYEDLQMFSQVLNQIRVNHPDSLDTHALIMAAIQGMVRAADPHSYVVPAVRPPRSSRRCARRGS